jgi:hypothetical protein
MREGWQYCCIASYILRILSILLLIVSILRMDWIWVFACSMAIVVSFVPTILKRDYQITLPWILDLLLASALLLHVGGGVLNAYHTIPGYDHITHFVSGVLIAFLAFVIIYILDVYWDGLHMEMHAMAFVVVIFTMAMGVVWELFEWSLDLLLGTQGQWGLDDTMMDLLIDTTAGIFVAVIGVRLVKRGKLVEFTKEFGEQIDRGIIHRDKP